MRPLMQPLAAPASPPAGYQVLSVTTPGTLKSSVCNLAAQFSYGSPALMQQCALTNSGTPTTALSVYVDQYCGGEAAGRPRCCWLH